MLYFLCLPHWGWNWTWAQKQTCQQQDTFALTCNIWSAWYSHSDSLGLIGCLELNWAQTETYNWTKSLWKWTDNFSGFTLSFHFTCVLRLNADAFRLKRVQSQTACLILSGRLADRVHVGYYCGNSCSEWRIFPSLTRLWHILDFVWIFFPWLNSLCLPPLSLEEPERSASKTAGMNWAVSASLCSINQRRGCSRLLQIILIKGVVPLSRSHLSGREVRLERESEGKRVLSGWKHGIKWHMETIDILWNLKGEARPVTQNWQRIETKQPLRTNLRAYWLIWAQIVLGQDFLFQMQMILKQYLRKSEYSFHTLHDLTSRSGVVSNLLFEPQSWYISTLLIWVYCGVSSLASWSQNSSLHQWETVETSLRDISAQWRCFWQQKGFDRDYQVQLRCAAGTFVLVFVDF